MKKHNILHLTNINSKYHCPECKNLFDELVYQKDCGCRLCSQCVSKTIEVNKICRYCNEEFSLTIPDKAFTREINVHVFNCPLCESFSGNIFQLKKHEIEQHQTNTCKICGEKLDQEKSHLCKQEIIDCEFKVLGCNENFLRKDAESHNNENISRHLVQLKNFIINNQVTNVTPKIDKLNIQEKYFTRLHESISKLELKFEKLEKEFSSLKIKQRENDEVTENKQRLLMAKLVTCEDRVNVLDSSSYNGTLTWKIINVNEKFEAAKSGRQTSFYSPIFYSSKYGYKMSTRVYLNGDGIGKNAYLSLFFVILRGEYDALLEWPFNNNVTFTLVDQSAKQEHIDDTFKPDPNSNSFKRPITDLNIASGIPQFCSLDKVFSCHNSYVKDNVMFIKVSINKI